MSKVNYSIDIPCYIRNELQQRGDIMARREFKWTDKQISKLEKVKEIFEQWANYLPLTLRQVFYQLVSKEIIENTVSQYTMLSNLLKHARIDGLISWENMTDRVRTFYSGIGWKDKNEFIENHLNRFLENYERHLMNKQDKFIEVWLEKDALSSIFSHLTSQYCISTVVCRGFASVTFLNAFSDRVKYYQSIGKKPVMLYFGDFDPSGAEMLPAMKETVTKEMGTNDIEFKRIALTKQDIVDYSLPHNAKAVKKSDTRYKKFVEKFGEYAIELDALPPNILEQKIKTAIENEIDIDLFNSQMEIEKQEVESLTSIKSKVIELLKDQLN